MRRNTALLILERTKATDAVVNDSHNACERLRRCTEKIGSLSLPPRDV